MFEDTIIFYLFLFPFLMIFMILISKKLNLVDKPNQRKIHHSNIVNITGIGIYIFLFFIILNYEIILEIEKIIFVGFFIVIIGFLDDRIDLKAKTKLFFLSIPSGYLILNGYQLDDLGTYEYFGKIELGELSIVFTLAAVLLLLNSINYLDGTDGLLIGYTITALAYFYLLGLKYNESFIIFLIFIYILLVSLFFNFLKLNTGLKSLLGDAGSLFIGFFISFTMITLHQNYKIHPAFLIWSSWLPIYDFLDVTFNRFKNKISVSQPDKSHFHHYILNYYSYNQTKTFIFINILNIGIIFFGYMSCLFFGDLFSIFLFMIFFIIFLKIKKNLKNSNLFIFLK